MKILKFYIDKNNKSTLAGIEFDYKSVCSQFATTHYVATHKIVHMYYLNKSHDLFNRSCD